MSRISFTRLSPGARDRLRSTLDAAGLPTGDLDQPEWVFELSDDQGPIGFVGMEGDGPDRLLRSLVVLPDRKRQGHGGLLLVHLETVARDEGATRLHLLTTTAEAFFRARGYAHAQRVDAPALIRSTPQFSSLCPASAVYLVKEII